MRRRLQESGQRRDGAGAEELKRLGPRDLGGQASQVLRGGVEVGDARGPVRNGHGAVSGMWPKVSETPCAFSFLKSCCSDLPNLSEFAC